MAINHLQYRDFSLRIHAKAPDRPIVGQFELTHQCNLRCRHCYLVPGREVRPMPLRSLYSIFDRVKKEGCLWVCLTGGEPLIREDFPEIYEYLHRRGFIITIFTNATLFTPGLAQLLKKKQPFAVQVTMNAATAATYEKISGVPGSFDKALAGIELMRAHGLPLQMRCTVMTLNIRELPAMQKLYKRMQVRFDASTVIDPRIDGDLSPCRLRIPAAKAARFSDASSGESVHREDAGFLYQCPGGTWMFYVDPAGKMFFCNAMRHPRWDLRRASFREVFYRRFAEIRAKRCSGNSPCVSCDVRFHCMRCPGKAKLECGDPEAPIPYYCDLTREWMRMKKRKHREKA